MGRFEATGTNMLDETDVGAVITNLHDITDQKRLEKSLREKTERHVAADRCNDKFSPLSHELRNSLAAAINGMQVLRQAGHKGPISRRQH